MKKIQRILLVFLFLITLVSCDNTQGEEIILPGNNQSAFTQTEGQKIPVLEVSAPLSSVRGHLDAFARYEKKEDEFPVIFDSSLLKTHQLTFTFDAVYPVDTILFINGTPGIQKISIDTSFNGFSFNRIFTQIELTEDLNEIHLQGTMSKAVRFIFDTKEAYEVKHIGFTLALGVIVREHEAWTNAFLRTEGWTGSDGIFAFNLTGNDHPGAEGKHAFVFSDTFIGEVYPHNYLRKSSTMINNSIGYYDPNVPFEEAISFDWDDRFNIPISIFKPDSYQGKNAYTLLSSDGLTASYDFEGQLQIDDNGTQFLTSGNEAEFIIDLQKTYPIKEMYLWNYRKNPAFGANQYELYVSNDQESWEEVSTGSLNLSDGTTLSNYQNKIMLNQEAQFIKLVISNKNEKIGLGKIMLFSDEDLPLFGQISGTPSDEPLTNLDSSSRLWIQDGVVIGDKLYLYPIIVKDFDTIFKVHGVGLIEVPIIEASYLDWLNATYYQTPLQSETKERDTIYMGAGMMHHVEEDGYIYIYGYKDPGRNLVVGRFKPEDVLDFNAYEYYNGDSFVRDINQVKGLKSEVSAELSVTHIKSGMFKDQYMLVVMEHTTSGRISYALSDTPFGPFDEYVQIFDTYENELFNQAFTYNAKMHPNLSNEGSWIITYNVNTNSLSSLANARIYHPRVLEMIEVKEKKE